MPEPPSFLHDWLLRTAARKPGHAAVAEPARVVTLEQLRERSLSLAGGLREHGVEPGERVGLVMDKSADAIIAIYASLFAGFVYVPLSPDWPPGRVDTVLNECGARLVITDQDPAQSETPGVTDRGSGATLSWSRLLSATPVNSQVVDRSFDDPAFILFTSGSTGPPKGVTISHRAVAAFVDWSAEHFLLSSKDRIICPSPLSFDLSTFDVFHIARCAATCVTAPRVVTWVPRLLLQLVREQEVTSWYSVPSVLGRLVERSGLEREPPSSLRLVLFAGEVMPPKLARRLRACLPAAELYNLYGPTETNVVTWFRLPEEIDELEPIPIGEPCPYATVRLEAEASGPGSDPSTASLLVAGESLMSGYWNRPEETARAFAPLEDDGDPRRYYRTGDRITHDASGRFQFVGRSDRQVKRRGYRIELGEIEAVLGHHPELAEAAVIVSGESLERLTAFVRPDRDGAVDEIELREHCAPLLPPYMIPDRFVVLREMPRGSRGKIDYGSLAQIDRRAS